MLIIELTFDRIKAIQQKVREWFSNPEREPYIAKYLMATLTACVFIPLLASGYNMSTIAGILGGIGGNLTADLISTFYQKHKKDKNAELKFIAYLHELLQKSPEFKKTIEHLIRDLEIDRVLHELAEKPNQEWLATILRRGLYSLEIHQDIQRNDSMNITSFGDNAKIVGKHVDRRKYIKIYKVGAERSKFRKLIFIAGLFIFLVFAALFVIINWPPPELIEITGGRYLSGKNRVMNSLPTFWIDTAPVTNKQYKIFVDATGHRIPKHWKDGKFPVGLDDHPVVNVSLHDAQDYAKWAKKRLPLMAEWEKACRGPNGNVYPWGDEWKSGICNTQEIGLGSTSPVGYYALNKSPYGCLDMVGNVWEWTITPDSSYSDFYYIMGGAFNQSMSVARCYDARSIPKSMSLENLGFRCVSDVAKD